MVRAPRGCRDRDGDGAAVSEKCNNGCAEHRRILSTRIVTVQVTVARVRPSAVIMMAEGSVPATKNSAMDSAFHSVAFSSQRLNLIDVLLQVESNLGPARSMIGGHLDLTTNVRCWICLLRSNRSDFII